MQAGDFFPKKLHFTLVNCTASEVSYVPSRGSHYKKARLCRSQTRLKTVVPALATGKKA